MTKNNSNSEVFPPNVNAIRKDRNINGGGIFVATRSDIISVHQVHLDTEYEIVWVDLQLIGSRRPIVGSFYRPPNQRDPNYLKQLRLSLSRIKMNCNTAVCLGGDFNLGDSNWTNSTVVAGSNKKVLGEIMIEIADQFDMKQIVRRNWVFVPLETSESDEPVRQREYDRIQSEFR